MSEENSVRLILASEIHAMRQKAGLRQEDLAALLQLPQSVISRMEKGERRVDIVELAALCRLCGLSLGAFIRRFETQLDKLDNAR